MLERFFGPRFHTQFHVFCLASLGAGLAWGKAIMSISFVLLIINFLLELKYYQAYQNLKQSKVAWFVLGFFLLYFLGLFWTDDFGVGIKELKSRLPMFVIPFIVVTRPTLLSKELNFVWIVFIISLIVTSILNCALYYNWIGNTSHMDIREMSHFGSHIRYSILIVLGIAICFYLYLKSKKYAAIYLAVIVWFLYYTFISEVLTGLISLVALGIATILFFLWKWKVWFSLSFLLIICLATYYLLSLMNNIKITNYELSELPEYTVNGNKYHHSNNEHSEVNGLPIYAFHSDKELEKEWNKKSKISYLEKDGKNHLLRSTLARYMTAIEVNRDSFGFQRLTQRDIENIELGFVYPTEKNEHLLPRIQGIRYQLMNRTNPNGHSMLQRFEYWCTAKSIISKNWLFGVGTGGNAAVFEKEYAHSNTLLLKENQLRSHNMFLSYWISFGVFGILLFVSLLLFLLIQSYKIGYLLGFQFIIIFGLSCLIEDTLETQMGVTIFGLFVGTILNNVKVSKEKQLSN